MTTTPQLTGIHQLEILNGTWPNRHLILMEFNDWNENIWSSLMKPAGFPYTNPKPQIEIMNEVGNIISPDSALKEYGPKLTYSDRELLTTILA